MSHAVVASPYFPTSQSLSIVSSKKAIYLVVSIKVIRNKITSQREGYGFVEFNSHAKHRCSDYLLQETFRTQYPSVRGAKVVVTQIGRQRDMVLLNFLMKWKETAMYEMNGVYCSTRQIVSVTTEEDHRFQQQYHGLQVIFNLIVIEPNLTCKLLIHLHVKINCPYEVVITYCCNLLYNVVLLKP
ncbi:Polyadenylate-binding protein RBP47B' [Camellia lanceoleosa]|uniref:Polyadenylate-binding protein RBP47B n=1 Tax=Camellia lanceoleosa TaxID=1840588 RepID=A0ACC0FY64_9ERIC|nr:Polyadenylate-binding protein RBP47B' [Camellia lanceoleosa]